MADNPIRNNPMTTEQHPIIYYFLSFFFRTKTEKKATLIMTPPRIIKNTDAGTYFLAMNWNV